MKNATDKYKITITEIECTNTYPKDFKMLAITTCLYKLEKDKLL